MKRYLLTLQGVVGTALGASLIMKVAIGLSPWDSLGQSISLATSIKVGTVGTILNISCFVLQLLLMKKEFKLPVLFQIPMSILLGWVVNLFYYDILSGLNVSNYGLKLIVYFIGLIILAFSIGLIMAANRIVFPLEGLCLQISKHFGPSFVKVRQGFDIASILLSLLLFVIFKTTLTIREGTILSMLIFGPLAGFFLEKLKPIIDKNC